MYVCECVGIMTAVLTQCDSRLSDISGTTNYSDWLLIG